MLYPQQNDIRNRLDLSGFWDFNLDPDEIGQEEGWFNGLESPRSIAVPGSWNEQLEDAYHYLGMAWYVRDFYVPSAWRGQRIFVRVGSANYMARVWVNGELVGEHEGGHLPFAFEISKQVIWQQPNTIAIQVENQLRPDRVPAGNLPTNQLGSLAEGFPSATFDFYPFAGLHRPVILYALPNTHIEDVSAVTDIDGDTGVVNVTVVHNGDTEVGSLSMVGEELQTENTLNFKDGVAEARLEIPNARLWSPDDPYLYDLTITLLDEEKIVDRYKLEIGIRTIEVHGGQLLLNGDPLFLKGFGRHEDFYASGRGLNQPLIVKDYGLLKWIGANSYRTSHYPYSEEEMRLADREGLLIIDEIPAVSLHFNDSQENMHRRLEQCKGQLRELIARDKNHPSVILWSVANEPVPPNLPTSLKGGSMSTEIDPQSTDFLKQLVDMAHELDSTRPATLVGIMFSPVQWLDLGDVICVNRYWGWYTQQGQPEEGARLLEQELDSLYAALQKPILISEFGADTIPGMHSHPPKMWTEEYQVEFLRGYLDVADRKEYILGLHVWNFADFQAAQSTGRVGGLNHKGVFTRARQPKMAAHFLRERWLAPRQLAKLVEKQLATDSDETLEDLLSGLVQDLDDKHPGLTQVLRVVLEDGGIYRLVFINGRCRLERGDGESAATIKMNAADAASLLRGDLDPMVAVAAGKMEVEGDVQALLILQ